MTRQEARLIAYNDAVSIVGGCAGDIEVDGVAFIQHYDVKKISDDVNVLTNNFTDILLGLYK